MKNGLIIIYFAFAICQEEHIAFIADSYLALAALQHANITDNYYTNSFSLADVGRINAQLLQQNLPMDDVNEIEDALSIIATSDTDIEKNKGYVRFAACFLFIGKYISSAIFCNLFAV